MKMFDMRNFTQFLRFLNEDPVVQDWLALECITVITMAAACCIAWNFYELVLMYLSAQNGAYHTAAFTYVHQHQQSQTRHPDTDEEGSENGADEHDWYAEEVCHSREQGMVGCQVGACIYWMSSSCCIARNLTLSGPRSVADQVSSVKLSTLA